MGSGYHRYIGSQVDYFNIKRQLKEDVYNALEELKDNFESSDSEINPFDESFTVNDLLEFIDINRNYIDAAEDFIFEWRKKYED